MLYLPGDSSLNIIVHMVKVFFTNHSRNENQQQPRTVLMNNFELDPRLKTDCIILGESENTILLLMNNALVHWFILVPKVDVFELYELDDTTQRALMNEVNGLSNFVKTHFDTDKLNVAAIGNVVKQLHIHVIGRSVSDLYWPNVVWGADDKKEYSKEEIERIKRLVKDKLGNRYALLA